MTLFQNIFKNNYIYLSIGFIIVVYTLYIRLIIVRLPRDLCFINDQGINITTIGLTISRIIVCVYSLILNYKIICKKTIKVTYFKRVITKVMETISKSLLEVYSYLINNVEDNYNKLANLIYSFICYIIYCIIKS